MTDDDTVIGYHSTGDPCGKGIRLSDLDEETRRRLQDYATMRDDYTRAIDRLNELERINEQHQEQMHQLRTDLADLEKSIYGRPNNE